MTLCSGTAVGTAVGTVFLILIVLTPPSLLVCLTSAATLRVSDLVGLIRGTVSGLVGLTRGVMEGTAGAGVGLVSWEVDGANGLNPLTWGEIVSLHKGKISCFEEKLQRFYSLEKVTLHLCFALIGTLL